MKKGPFLNSELSYQIAKLGHMDQLTISDAGLPIPENVPRIDLALTQGVPGFLQVLDVVLLEMQVEAVILAEEIKQKNPDLYRELNCRLETLGKQQGRAIPVTLVSHEQFKKQTQQSRAVVRSGECSPYANIILCAGVTF